MRKPRVSEVEIARNVIGFLTAMRWEVFQEVTGAVGRADIVARQGTIVWIIETKAAFGLPVIEQAQQWCPHAHLVSIATPSRPGEFGKNVCRSFGVGIIEARGSYSDGSGTSELVRPRLNRKPWRVPVLCEEQKTYAEAGSNSGGYFTPWRRTMRLVAREVAANPGISVKELVDRIDHHYGSDTTARQCLAKWLIAGEVPGFGIRQEGRKNIVVKCEAPA